MKPGKLLKVLEALGYEVVRRKGSHKSLRAPGRPALTFSYHGGDEVPSQMVRTILVKQVGLTLDEAREAIR